MTLRNATDKPVKASLRPRYYATDGRELLKGPLYSLAIDVASGQTTTLTDSAPVPGATSFTCEFLEAP